MIQASSSLKLLSRSWIKRFVLASSVISYTVVGRYPQNSSFLFASAFTSPVYHNHHRRHYSAVPATTATTTSLKMTKRVLVPIGEGSEEIETTCVTDTLTRFGAEVTIASVMNGELLCKMSRGIKVMADTTIEEAAKEEWDLIVLPGGMPGAEHLRDSKPLTELLNKQKQASKSYAAICAAPAVALASQGLAEDGSTCYPAPPFREKLRNPSDDPVVVTGKVTTSQGPGTALLFALELGEQLFGKEKRDTIQQQMLV